MTASTCVRSSINSCRSAGLLIEAVPCSIVAAPSAVATMLSTM
jgi:hypothetical protein